MYNATVTIGEKQWAVSVATGIAELIAGLSGVAELAPNTGMLFDMGSDQSSIDVSMAGMLFPLDIAFLSVEHGVVGLVQTVQPEQTGIGFSSGGVYPARYFLEVNALEMTGVQLGDAVTIVAEEQVSTGIDMNSIMSMMIVMMMMGMMMKSMGNLT